ncbi:MAG: hypothetical protein KJ622_15085 [Alphaproteobacteria bacterium]|nr:hypothetical protein [Alphaproteobacteria bacterium]
MMEFVYKIIDVDTQTIYLIILVSVVSAFLQREIIGSDLFTYISLPTFIAASFVSLFVCRENYWLILGDPIIEVIVSSIIAITLSFMVFLLAVNLSSAFTGWNVRRMLKKRNLDGGSKQAKPRHG